MTVVSESMLRRMHDEYKRRFLDKEPYQKQLDFVAHTANVPIFYLCGGVRSGKSFIAMLMYSIMLTGYYPSWYKGRIYRRPIQMAILSKDLDNFKKTVQKYLFGDPLRNIPGLIHPSLITNIVYHAGGNKVIKSVYIKNRFYGESVLDAYTYEQGSQKIQGTSYDVLGADELPPFPTHQEIMSRLIQFADSPDAPPDYPYGLYVISATPQHLQKNIYHMTAASFFADEDGNEIKPEVEYKNRMYMLLSWDDNPYLTEEGKDILAAQYPAHELQLRKYGIPTFGGNLVYPYIDEYEVIIEPFVIPDSWPRFFAADYGMKDETVFLFFAIDPNSGVNYLYAEYGAARMKIHQHADNLRGDPHYADIIPGVADRTMKKTESDNVSVYQKFIDYGINLVRIADNSIEPGIDVAYLNMRTGRAKIMKHCNRTIRQLYGLRYGEKGKPEESMPQDYADAYRYGQISGPDVAVAFDVLMKGTPEDDRGEFENWRVYS